MVSCRDLPDPDSTPAHWESVRHKAALNGPCAVEQWARDAESGVPGETRHLQQGECESLPAPSWRSPGEAPWLYPADRTAATARSTASVAPRAGPPSPDLAHFCVLAAHCSVCAGAPGALLLSSATERTWLLSEPGGESEPGTSVASAKRKGSCSRGA